MMTKQLIDRSPMGIPVQDTADAYPPEPLTKKEIQILINCLMVTPIQTTLSALEADGSALFALRDKLRTMLAIADPPADQGKAG